MQEYVAIAISASPIGIDIESINRNALALIKSYLQLKEICDLVECSNTSEEALLLWGVKEAAFKLASEKVAVLKDIRVEKKIKGYAITYPDSSTAVCKVQIIGDILLAVAEYDY